MTSEEYRAIRTALGLTQEDAMRLHNLKNVRTIKRWESDSHVTSEKACDEILSLLKLFNKCVNTMVDDLRDEFDATPREEWSTAVLIQYSEAEFKKYASELEKMTYNTYKALVQRIYTELSEEGYPVGIIAFNQQDCDSFLSKYGLKDTEEARALWAHASYNKR